MQALDPDTLARIRSLELARDFSERVTDQGLQLAVADVDPLLPHLPARSDIGARLEVWRAYDAIRDTHPSTPEKTAASLVQALPTDFSLDPDTYVTRIRQAFDRELEALQRLPEQASRAHSDRLRKAPAFPERGTSTEQIAWANDTLGLLRRATGVANRYGLQASLETLSTAYTRAARHWERLQDYDDPEGWVRRVAWNLALSTLRRADRPRRDDPDPPSLPPPAPIRSPRSARSPLRLIVCPAGFAPGNVHGPRERAWGRGRARLRERSRDRARCRHSRPVRRRRP